MVKKLFLIVFAVFVGFILVSSGVLFFLSRGLDETLEVEIVGIDLSNVEDGVYQGTYENRRFSNTLEVHVENHEIVDIIVIDDMTLTQDGVTEEVFARVMALQSTDIDMVAGASVTTTAYLKAIENALKGGMIHE